MIMETVRRTTRTDCGHGCVIRRAGEVRASAPIRALVAAIVAFACAISIVSNAFAAESGGGGGGHSFEGPNVGIIFYGPTPTLDSNANQVNEVGVTAYSEFDAAAYVLGYSYGEVRSWSADIRAKLSNSETGGRFWQFAQTFTHTNNIDGVQWFVANVLYGADLCWRSLYSDDLYRNALADCQTIINGGNVGGGSGESGNGAPTEIPFIPLVATWYTSSPVMKIGGINYYLAYSGVETATKMKAPNPFTIKLPSDVYSNVPEGDYVYAYSFLPRLNGSNISGSIQITAVPADSYTLRPNDYFSQYNMIVPNEGTLCYVMYVNSLNVSTNYLGVDLSNVTFSKSTVTYGTANTLGATGYARYFYDTLQSVGGGGGGEPVVPPTNWPEPDVPDPPELPEPGTNPTVTPTPWAPVISPTFDFDLNITTEPTSNDLIDWVKKIYFELRSFHSDAQDWFDEVGKGIDGVIKALDDAQKQIYSELQTIDNTLRDEGQKIRDYMYQMFHWLKDQLNFQNDTFNDSNIVYWLKRIWSKLGNGDINVRPTDPTTDPTGVWDWLIKLIQNFLIGLASSANDLISEMADLVSQVMHQFPFSIPWDIAAFLSAFAAAPITPDVDVTIPAIEGWWGETVISIDLSSYDTAAAAVRAMEKILFAAFLAWKSKDLLEFMDVTKWFNG